MLWAAASRDLSARQSRRTLSHPPPQSASEGIGGARGLGNLVRPESHPEVNACLLWAAASRDPPARQSRRTCSHPPHQSASEGIGGARGLRNLVRPESHRPRRVLLASHWPPGCRLSAAPRPSSPLRRLPLRFGSTGRCSRSPFASAASAWLGPPADRRPPPRTPVASPESRPTSRSGWSQALRRW